MKKHIIISSILLLSMTFSTLYNFEHNYTTSSAFSSSLNVPNSDTESYILVKKLNVLSSGIKDGFIDPEYGSASENKFGAMPLESIPLQWSKGPENTKTYAITLIDYDTVPIIGFPWIHWLVADIPANITSLPANSSTTMSTDFKQGVTSYADGYLLELKGLNSFQVPRKEAFHYGGMSPINFAHKYTIAVYALDTTLKLDNGFGLNDLYNSIEKHVVGFGYINGVYNAHIDYLQ